jgi:hypothetical protein
MNELPNTFHLSITGLRVRPGIGNPLRFRYHALRSYGQVRTAVKPLGVPRSQHVQPEAQQQHADRAHRQGHQPEDIVQGSPGLHGITTLDAQRSPRRVRGKMTEHSRRA